MLVEAPIIVLTRTRDESWLTPGSESSSFGSFSTCVLLSISDLPADSVKSKEEKNRNWKEKGKEKGRRIDSQLVGTCDDAHVPP